MRVANHTAGQNADPRDPANVCRSEIRPRPIAETLRPEVHKATETVIHSAIVPVRVFDAGALHAEMFGHRE